MAAEPARILFVNHEVELGGGEHSLLELCRAMDRRQFEPHLACSGTGPLTTEAAALGVAVHDVPMRFRSRLRKLVGLAAAIPRLRRIVATARIDLVHANSLLAGYVATFAAPVPTVWHVRDMTYPWLGRQLCRRADRVIANSSATAATLPGIDATVIHNGVGDRFFDAGDHRTSVRRDLGLGEDAILIGMVGRLDPWKGHRTLLDAAAEVSASRRDVTFVIIGDVTFDGARQRNGDYRAELEARAANLGIQKRVRFVGRRDDVPRWMSALDVLAQPSEQPEPFGRSVAEAMACGVPVVAAAHGGPCEIIEDGVHGALVPPNSAERLAAALQRLIDEPELRQRAGAAARDHAEEKFRARAYAGAVAAVWRSLLGDRVPRPEPVESPTFS